VKACWVLNTPPKSPFFKEGTSPPFLKGGREGLIDLEILFILKTLSLTLSLKGREDFLKEFNKGSV
ncbi:MAG: hypothetical protein WCD61_08640, partial [Acinetobacter bohemicus]